MISAQSNSYFSIINRIKYKKFKLFNRKNIESFVNLIKYGIIPRTHYALGLLLASHQAYELGFKKISVIEFGCWNCEGLIDLENYITDIKNFFEIDFQVFGFDLGSGHPNYNSDTRDRLYEIPAGLYPFEKKENLKKLKFSELILGDVKETLINFLEDKKIVEAPIGFISFDLGLYNSTKHAIKLLEKDSKFFLPRTSLYFDNNYFVLDNEGDKLASEEFNDTSHKKISDVGELAEQLSFFWKKWIFMGKRIKILSDQKHPKFNNYYEPKIMKLLNKNFP
jgi:hypothetical protein|tara:strand:+ start:252 stop:1091 length:840 start_codon:yes stop_codon:yes gene_type:complete